MKCPECDRPIHGDTSGLCPYCLLHHGLSGYGEAELDVPGRAVGRDPSLGAVDGEIADLFPDLRIESVLGSGGIGIVYKAIQLRLNRPIALKLLRPELADDPDLVERFRREAKALARLDHPNIVAVHDFGVAGGFCYLMMQWVDGGDLRSSLCEGRLTVDDALATAYQLCAALQYAHERGVVHRDIKPENILIDRSGIVKVADFGLAKILLDDLEPPNLLTSDRKVIGTPRYIAPEQLESPSEADHRADIFALGVVIDELFSSRPPSGDGRASDSAIESIVSRALQRDRHRRYQTVREIDTDLHRYAADIRRDVVQTQVTARLRPFLVRAFASPVILCLIYTGALFAIFKRRRNVEWLFDMAWPIAQMVLPIVTVAWASQRIVRERGRFRPPKATETSLAPRGPLGESDPSTEDRSIARLLVRGPAVGLITVGMLYLAAALGFSAALILHPEASFGKPFDTRSRAAVIGMVVLMAALGVTLGVAGARAMALKSYRTGLLGALLAMIPLPPMYFLGLLVGLWSLIALTDGSVYRAHRGRPAGRRDDVGSSLAGSSPATPPGSGGGAGEG